MIVTKTATGRGKASREGSLKRVRQEWPCRHDQGLGSYNQSENPEGF